jgi:DNA-binding SARP family transcriptional activator
VITTGAGDHTRSVNLIDIKILGTLQVHRDGTAIRLTPIPAKALLILLNENGKPLAKATLQERLYDRDPDRLTDLSGRRVIKELRDLLTGSPSPEGDSKPVIPLVRYVDSTNYLIRADAVRVDADQQQQQVAAGSAALAAGRPAEAATLLATAMQLWRGVPLPELPDKDWAREWINRISQWRRVGVGAHAEALVRLGRQHEAIPGMYEHVAAYPEDGSLRTLLIVALYSSWRDHEATAACRDAISALHEHGLEATWLHWLQQQVLQLRLPRDGGLALDLVRTPAGR